MPSTFVLNKSSPTSWDTLTSRLLGVLSPLARLLIKLWFCHFHPTKGEMLWNIFFFFSSYITDKFKVFSAQCSLKQQFFSLIFFKINHYIISKIIYLYSHLNCFSVTGYIGGEEIGRLHASSFDIWAQRSSTEGEEWAATVIFMLISLSLCLQSTGTRPNALFICSHHLLNSTSYMHNKMYHTPHWLPCVWINHWFGKFNRHIHTIHLWGTVAGIRRGYVNTCSGMFVVTVSHCAVSIFLFLVAILSPGLTASSEVKKKYTN